MSLLRFFGLFFLLLLVLVMMQNMPKQTPSPYVIAKGQDFYLQDKQFRAIGANRYNLLTHTARGGHVGCANAFSEAQIDTMFSHLHSMGVTTVRFWAFQSFTKSGQDMERFDYVLATAEKYNIKLIPVFENHWADCTEEGVKSQEWYATGYKNAYGAYPRSLKQYISAVVMRYKDNPTILAWEIINEPRDVEERVLHDFANDISQHIKAIDKHHLVSIGMAGAYSSDVLYESVYALPTIDFVDYHDYDHVRESFPVPMAARMELAKKLHKPMVIGESGVEHQVAYRGKLFDEKMQTFFQNGGDVYMIWSYGDEYITNDSFNFKPHDEVAQVVSKNSKILNK